MTLTEMLADDGARRAVGTDALRRAVERVGDAGESGAYPESASGANPDAAMLVARLDRLDVDPVDEGVDRAGRGADGSADVSTVRTAAVVASVALVAVPVTAMAAILGIVRRRRYAKAPPARRAPPGRR